MRDRQQKKVSLLYFVSLIMVFPLVYCNFALNCEVCEASFFDDFTSHRLQWRFILLKSALWNLNARFRDEFMGEDEHLRSSFMLSRDVTVGFANVFHRSSPT